MTNSYAFISHSSADKQFARRLDDALAYAGVRTFLDERDIRIGESIPEQLFSAINQSTHLIYVISKNSATSAWAREELSAAQFRRLSSASVTVLPIRIDDTLPPDSIAHLKYADFSSWQLDIEFARSMQRLLQDMGIEVPSVGSTEVKFLTRHFSDLLLIGELALTMSSELEGGQTLQQAIVWTSAPKFWAPYAISYSLEDKFLLKKVDAFIQKAGDEMKVSDSQLILSLHQRFFELPRLLRDFENSMDCATHSDCELIRGSLTHIYVLINKMFKEALTLLPIFQPTAPGA